MFVFEQMFFKIILKRICLFAYKLHGKHKKGGKQSATQNVNKEYLPIEKRKSLEAEKNQAIDKHAEKSIFAKGAPFHFLMRGYKTIVFIRRREGSKQQGYY